MVATYEFSRGIRNKYDIIRFKDPYFIRQREKFATVVYDLKEKKLTGTAD